MKVGDLVRIRKPLVVLHIVSDIEVWLVDDDGQEFVVSIADIEDFLKVDVFPAAVAAIYSFGDAR